MTQMVVNETHLSRTASVKNYIGIAILLALDEGLFITGKSVDGGVAMP